MNLAFVCAKQDDDAWPDELHETAFAMKRCTRCDRFAVAGYLCVTCGHEDTTPADQLAGHGEGKCEARPAEVSA